MTNTEQPSPRAILRGWVREQVDGQEEVHVPKLADAALAHFRSDQTFLDALLAENLPSMVSDVCRTVLAKTRFIHLGDEYVTREAFEGRATSRWDLWMEHAGDRHVALTAMTKVDLLTAAEERDHRAAEESRRAKFLRTLAAPLKQGETVGAHFTAEQLDQTRQVIWPNVKKETKEAAA